MIKIKTKLSFKAYVRLLYGLIYKKPIMIVIVCVGFAMLVWILGYRFDLLPLPKPTIYQYITLGLITIVQPLVIYSTIWNNYYSANHLREALEIEFTPLEIKIHGESFYTELTWEKTFKVEELNNWFLIYQNNLSAVIVQKKFFSESQLKDFKKLLRGVRDIPVHLQS